MLEDSACFICGRQAQDNSLYCSDECRNCDSGGALSSNSSVAPSSVSTSPSQTSPWLYSGARYGVTSLDAVAASKFTASPAAVRSSACSTLTDSDESDAPHGYAHLKASVKSDHTLRHQQQQQHYYQQHGRVCSGSSNVLENAFWMSRAGISLENPDSRSRSLQEAEGGQGTQHGGNTLQYARKPGLVNANVPSGFKRLAPLGGVAPLSNPTATSDRSARTNQVSPRSAPLPTMYTRSSLDSPFQPPLRASLDGVRHVSDSVVPTVAGSGPSHHSRYRHAPSTANISHFNSEDDEATPTSPHSSARLSHLAPNALNALKHVAHLHAISDSHNKTRPYGQVSRQSNEVPSSETHYSDEKGFYAQEDVRQRGSRSAQNARQHYQMDKDPQFDQKTQYMDQAFAALNVADPPQLSPEMRGRSQRRRRHAH